MTVVVGVDPGARYTGIVVAETTDRAGALRLVTHRTVERDEVYATPEQYADEVWTAIQTMLVSAPHGRWIVGVESWVAPSSHMHGKLSFIDPEPLLAAAWLAGVITGRFTGDRADAVYQVAPGGNGKAVYQQYPDALVSAQERMQPNWQIRQAGEGKLRHVRSAFDVCRVADRMDRPHRRG